MKQPQDIITEANKRWKGSFAMSKMAAQSFENAVYDCLDDREIVSYKLLHPTKVIIVMRQDDPMNSTFRNNKLYSVYELVASKTNWFGNLLADKVEDSDVPDVLLNYMDKLTLSIMEHQKKFLIEQRDAIADSKKFIQERIDRIDRDKGRVMGITKREE